MRRGTAKNTLSKTPPPSSSPVGEQKGLPMQLKEVLAAKSSGGFGGEPPASLNPPGLSKKKSRSKVKRNHSRMPPAVDSNMLSNHMENVTTLLKFRGAWEKCIAEGDEQKVMAFTAKACKLLQQSLKICEQVGGKKKDLKWAVVVCQSRIRTTRAQKMLKKHLYRFKVANEMVNTERSYMRAIGIVLSTYRRAAEKCLGVQDVNTIFGNLDSLRTINVPFWKDLETRVREWNVDSCVGNIYLKSLKGVLGEYMKYVQGYDSALKLHEKYLATKKEYSKLMDECLSDEVAQGLTLGAYLILPVQRFPRYQLLLLDMLKNTPAGHEDHFQLKQALDEVVVMCNQINKATQNSANYQALQKIERYLDGGFKITDKLNRVLKTEAEIQEMVAGRWQQRSVLIFDDMIVCVVKKSNKDEGWHVEWKVEGANTHALIDKATLELYEFRRTKKPPYSETVKHTIKPAEPYGVTFWGDTIRQYQSSANIPAIMSDTHNWLMTNLVTPKDWELLRLPSKAKSYSKDDVIVSAGQKVADLYIVDYGSVSRTCPMGKHVHVPLLEHSKGSFFGIECLLRDAHFPHEIISCNASAISRIPFAELVDILGADPHLNHRFWLLVCVTVAEKFHAWEMPKAIEKHYSQLTAGTDPNIRDTMSALFAPKEVKQVHSGTVKRSSTASKSLNVGGPGASMSTTEEDERVCTLFDIPTQAITHIFQDIHLGQKGKINMNRGGELYVFSSLMCFHSKLMGRTTKETFPFSAVQKIALDNNDPSRIDLLVNVSGRTENYFLAVTVDNVAKKVCETLQMQYTKFKRLSSSDNSGKPEGAMPNANNRRKGSPAIAPSNCAAITLTEAQWDLVLEKCGYTKQFLPGQAVVEEGQVAAKIFQILTGSCRVETEVEVIEGSAVKKVVQVVGSLRAGDLFGEKSYLFGGATTAAVIADRSGAEVYCLDRGHLERLFGIHPELAGPFYKTLAENIESRLFSRNDSVLRNYSALLVKKIKSGEITVERLKGNSAVLPRKLLDSPPPPATSPSAIKAAQMRVARPIRKESLGQLPVPKAEDLRFSGRK